jgi:hypothetical protein
MEYYPRMMYHWTGRFLMCESASHEKAMGDGWFRNPQEAQSYALSIATAQPDSQHVKTGRTAKVN